LERRQYQRDVARSRAKAERHAIRDSGRHVQLLELPRKPSHRTVQLVELETRYWELMREGISNTAACRLLGMHRKSGTRIRKNSHHQTMRPKRPAPNSGRYLALRERLQIADLERLGYSIRRISVELGRHPPRSNVNWTATVTSAGGTYLTAPMMHGFGAVRHASTS
jgi:IS30 family transposase